MPEYICFRPSKEILRNIARDAECVGIARNAQAFRPDLQSVWKPHFGQGRTVVQREHVQFCGIIGRHLSCCVHVLCGSIYRCSSGEVYFLDQIVVCTKFFKLENGLRKKSGFSVILFSPQTANIPPPFSRSCLLPYRTIVVAPIKKVSSSSIMIYIYKAHNRKQKTFFRRFPVRYTHI